MTTTRKYSKSVANGNHVVWTSQEVIPVPFALDGLVFNEAEWGVFRVTGRDMFCSGFRVDFRVPSGDANIQCNVGIYTAENVLAAGGRLYVNGVTMGGDKVIAPPLAMPVNSIWKFKMEIESPSGDETFFPQGVTATYLLRYAPGAVNTNLFSTRLATQGVGFDQVGSSFVVE